jgi:hypothetical protein
LYAIWYDRLNIANIGATEYGNIQVNNILYTCKTVNTVVLVCYFVNLLQKWYPTINHNEMNHHGDSRALRYIKNAANQRKRRQDPARREAENVADTARWCVAREQPGRREEEQEANTAQRRIAREQPGRRDEENE